MLCTWLWAAFRFNCLIVSGRQLTTKIGAAGVGDSLSALRLVAASIRKLAVLADSWRPDSADVYNPSLQCRREPQGTRVADKDRCRDLRIPNGQQSALIFERARTRPSLRTS